MKGALTCCAIPNTSSAVAMTNICADRLGNTEPRLGCMVHKPGAVAHLERFGSSSQGFPAGLLKTMEEKHLNASSDGAVMKRVLRFRTLKVLLLRATVQHRSVLTPYFWVLCSTTEQQYIPQNSAM